MDARNFLFSSDYPMPVLVWQYEDYWNVGAYNTRTVTVPHGLPFKPLLVGYWSTKSNYQPSQDIGTFTWMPYFNPVDGIAISAYVSADANNLILDMQNFDSTQTKFYFRIWAYAPPDYTGEYPNIYDNTNFQLSTDFNYPKIVKQGKVQLAYKASATIDHGLGYIPQCKVWQEKNGKIGPVYALWDYDQSGNRGGPKLTTSSLIIRNLDLDGDSKNKTYYYHIYGDEQ